MVAGYPAIGNARRPRPLWWGGRFRFFNLRDTENDESQGRGFGERLLLGCAKQYAILFISGGVIEKCTAFLCMNRVALFLRCRLIFSGWQPRFKLWIVSAAGVRSRGSGPNSSSFQNML